MTLFSHMFWHQHGPGMVNIQDAMDAESLQCFGGKEPSDHAIGAPGQRFTMRPEVCWSAEFPLHRDCKASWIRISFDADEY